MLIKPNGGNNNKSPSYELRGSRMYTNCDCWRRNGLQDSCPRSSCQGKSGCMNMPSPNCGPSSYQMKFSQMTMGLSKRPYETVMNNGLNNMSSMKGDSDYSPYEGMGATQMNGTGGYPGYQSDIPVQMSQSPETWPSAPSNGIHGTGNWNSSPTQQNYPCYI